MHQAQRMATATTIVVAISKTLSIMTSRESNGRAGPPQPAASC
jgi:hypothetical protein